MTDLLVLAIGLVLGALCAIVLLSLRRMREDIGAAESVSAQASARSEHAISAAKIATGQLNTHDHEIARLFEKAGLRRE